MSDNQERDTNQRAAGCISFSLLSHAGLLALLALSPHVAKTFGVPEGNGGVSLMMDQQLPGSANEGSTSATTVSANTEQPREVLLADVSDLNAVALKSPIQSQSANEPKLAESAKASPPDTPALAAPSAPTPKTAVVAPPPIITQVEDSPVTVARNDVAHAKSALEAKTDEAPTAPKVAAPKPAKTVKKTAKAKMPKPVEKNLETADQEAFATKLQEVASNESPAVDNEPELSNEPQQKLESSDEREAREATPPAPTTAQAAQAEPSAPTEPSTPTEVSTPTKAKTEVATEAATPTKVSAPTQATTEATAEPSTVPIAEPTAGTESLTRTEQGGGSGQAGNGNAASGPVGGFGSPQGTQVRDSSLLTQQPGNRPPVYPQQDRMANRQGTVVMVAEILKDGRVGSVSIQRSSGSPTIDSAAVQAYKNWRYLPGQQGLVIHPFKFQLAGDTREQPSLLRRR